jgi:CHAT domain-containing protein/Flp pilus assembly protein TadD
MLNVLVFFSIASSSGWGQANQPPVPAAVAELFEEVAQLQRASKAAESVERLGAAIAAAEAAGIDPARLADLLTSPTEWLRESDPVAGLRFLRLRLKLRLQQEPPDDLARGDAMSDLGTALFYLGEYSEAEAIFVELLELRIRTAGAVSERTAETLNDLGLLHLAKGDYRLAESRFLRALEVRRTIAGGDGFYVANTMADLSIAYRDMGRFDEARDLLERALTIYRQNRERTNWREHVMEPVVLNRLALIYQMRGPFGPAVGLYREAIALTRKLFGNDHANVFGYTANLGSTYRALGRYAEAEISFREAVEGYERVLGAERNETIKPLGNLGNLLVSEGRFVQGAALLRRALDVELKTAGEASFVAAELTAMLGSAALQAGMPDEARRHYQQAVDRFASNTGTTTVDYAASLHGLGEAESRLRYLDEAASRFEEAGRIIQRVVARPHPLRASALQGLAGVRLEQGMREEAERLIATALIESEQSVGSDHPRHADLLRDSAALHARTGDLSIALKESRQANAILVPQLELLNAAGRGGTALVRPRAARFSEHVQLLWTADRTAFDESLTAAQRARLSEAGTQLAQMAARQASGKGPLAELIRDRQDAAAQVTAIDDRLVEAIGKPTVERAPNEEAEMRAKQATLKRRIVEIDRHLHVEFPQFASLLGQQPVSRAQIRSVLKPREAVVSYLVSDAGCFVWVIVGGGRESTFQRLPIDRQTLERLVDRLRRHLDPGRSEVRDASSFDFGVAHQLYTALIEPIAHRLPGVRTLLVVPDGPISRLPLHVLVTDAPVPGAVAQKPKWLLERYAIVTWPSETSLVAVRSTKARGGLSRSFIGFGDPVLPSPRAGEGSSTAVESLAALVPLPETERELHALATAVGGGQQNVFLRDRATKVVLTKLPLEDVATIAFATHGLTAAESGILREPALVLSAPSPEDWRASLLTASEIAELRLGAEWVILSACNTASGREGNQEPLSGLARSFFYAGARALLVSHWRVESVSAVRITTSMMNAYSRGADKAVALQQAMLLLMQDKRRAHPAFWAPFVVVGDTRGAMTGAQFRR